MLILQPTEEVKIINITPRKSTIEGDYVMTIRRDGDGTEEEINDAIFNEATNFVEVIFISSILKEDSTYSLEITNDNNLWYRDKIYVTTQSKEDIRVNKHEILSDSLYKSYGEEDDNSYTPPNGGTPEEPTELPPVISIITYQNNYITIGEDYTYQIIASNSPISYDAYPLPEGLSVDTVTGIISGVVIGVESVFTTTLSATNEYGTTTRPIDFYLTNDSADDFLAPYNLTASNVRDGSFMLRWDTRPYNRVISASEVYKQGILQGTVYHTDSNERGSENKFQFNDVNGNFEYTVRLINSAGEYSPLSEVFAPILFPNSGELYTNESVVKTNPTLSDAVAYYKMDSVDGAILTDETGVNNGSIQGNSLSTVTGVVNNAIRFNASTEFLQKGVVLDSDSLSFGDGVSDTPFSISFWFKSDGTEPYLPLLLKENEWNFSISAYEGNPDRCLFSLVDSSFTPNRTLNKFSTLEPPFFNQWNHVAITYIGNRFSPNSIQIYFNNQYRNSTIGEANPTNAYIAMQSTDGKLYIGNDNREDGYRQQTIDMDELSIFNRVLTKDEINFLYNDGLGNSIT